MSDVATETPLLQVRALRKEFPVRRGLMRRVAGSVRAVSDVDLDIRRGECFGLVGESGCGKTTLGRTILRLIEPDGGSIYFDGADLLALGPEELRAFRSHAQIIFQDPYGSLNPRLTAGQAIGEGVRLRNRGMRNAECRMKPGRRSIWSRLLNPQSAIRNPQFFRGGAVRERVRELLATVGLSPDAEHSYPHEFSGGQRQRIGIARALSVEPSFIVCDEPVSALDVSVRAQIINLLRDLQRRFGLAYLFIAHDLAVVRHLCDTVAVMYLGKIVERAAADELFASPAHPYTIALLSAIPVPDPRVRVQRLVLEGDVPSPMNPPPGCAFHPRCPLAAAVCREATPQLIELSPPSRGRRSPGAAPGIATAGEVGPGHPVACHRTDAARELAERLFGK